MSRLCNPKWRKDATGKNPCTMKWNKLGEAAYKKLLVLNSNPKLDIAIYNRCRKLYSKRAFFAGHRNGQDGFCGGQHTHDIDQFIRGYDWTLALIRRYKDRDCRYWVDIQAI